LTFQPHYGIGVDSSSNRNEYLGYLLGVKVADNLATLMYHLFINSGSLNLLELQGPVQACTGFALPLQQKSDEFYPFSECDI